MGLLKFVFGGILAVAGFFGMVTIFIGTFIASFIASIEGLDLPLLPAIIYGFLSFLVFLTGIYFLRSH